MGSGRKPGHTCSSNGKQAIDGGTNCRARSPKPGPTLGLDAGAAPADDAGLIVTDVSEIGAADGGIQIVVDKSLDANIQKKTRPMESDPDTREKISGSIALLKKTPLAKQKEGGEVIKLLQKMNKDGLIIYAAMDEFGAWDGEFIHINDNFQFRPAETAVELAHEGTHALWRKNHPKHGATLDKNEAENNIRDEVNARRNQLVVYKSLKAQHLFTREGIYTGEMDKRVDLLDTKDGLRKAVEDYWHH